MEDEPVKDAAYWAEVRQAVGRGAPSILLGTSRRALDRAVRRLAASAPRIPGGRAMNLPDSTFLAYIVVHEAWYAPPGQADLLNVYAGGGTDVPGAWEFKVWDYGSPDGAQVEMLPGSYAAYVQIPEFFGALARAEQDGQSLSLQSIRGILDSLGAVDETKRERLPPLCTDRYCMLRMVTGEHPAHADHPFGNEGTGCEDGLPG